MNKSFVTMESKVCMTCGCEYSTGTILLDKRIQNLFERDTLTGWGLCAQHAQAAKEGLVALIEVDPDKSTPRGGKLMPDDAYRTGRVVLIKREALQRALVNIDIPEDCPFMFIDIQAFNKMLPPEDLANAPEESDRSTAGNVAPGSSRVN